MEPVPPWTFSTVPSSMVMTSVQVVTVLETVSAAVSWAPEAPERRGEARAETAMVAKVTRPEILIVIIGCWVKLLKVEGINDSVGKDCGSKECVGLKRVDCGG